MEDPAVPDQDPNPISLLHPRREPFDYGLLPIPKLIFTDPIQPLTPLKKKLLSQSPDRRVTSDVLADSLQISIDQANLLLDTLASVLHSVSDPLLGARASEAHSVGADVCDLILFLYIQSYKKLLPKPHKDSAAVTDVWPSTSAFDGYLSALSPLQLVRSTSRRFIPSQTDEEAHQLLYLQKHLVNIISLLADTVEGDGDESLVLTVENLEHLSFLIEFGDKESDMIPLSQAAPFFANLVPDMPALPVPLGQVHDWLQQSIAAALENISRRVSAKDNGTSNISDPDVAMDEAATASVKCSISSRGPCFIEGISKSYLVKQASDLKGSSLKVVNCQESIIYILAPVKYATIYGCSDATIVLGAVGKAVRVEHCERVHVIAAARRVCIANCRECVFYLGVNQQPLIVGDNHKLQLAPYNTFYSELEEDLKEADIDVSMNKWDEPITLGIIDPHDSLSHPSADSDAIATRLDPDQFTNFLIPNGFGGEQGSTDGNPFQLPDAYMESQLRNKKNLEEMKQLLRNAPLVETRKRELSSAIHVHFKEWLYASGNVRQLLCLQGD